MDLAAIPQTEGKTDRRAAAKKCSDRSRESRLRGKEGSASSHAESTAPPGGVSEPGVLQSSGDAALDVQQAACDRMWPGISPAHRRAARMPGGDFGASGGAQDQAQSSGRTVRGQD